VDPLTGYKLHDDHNGMSKCSDSDQLDNVRVVVLLESMSFLQERQLHIVVKFLSTRLDRHRETG